MSMTRFAAVFLGLLAVACRGGGGGTDTGSTTTDPGTVQDVAIAEETATTPDSIAVEDTIPLPDTMATPDVPITGDTTVAPEATGPAGHSDDQQGILHMAGKEDPLKNCTACHGAALTGGNGPSCYTCHNDSDHTGQHGHKSGAGSTCNACHGPNNSGGIGPACKKCH